MIESQEFFAPCGGIHHERVPRDEQHMRGLDQAGQVARHEARVVGAREDWRHLDDAQFFDRDLAVGHEQRRAEPAAQQRLLQRR
ncbi:MAG: hypothetical protein IPI73_00215 [Betaproteobacteria bacterium]|nr:hypothetical protein [Betaproteobacteria bacterium]